MTMSLADAFAMKSKQDRRQSNQEAAKERVLQSDYAQNRIQAAIELVEDVQDDSETPPKPMTITSSVTKSIRPTRLSGHLFPRPLEGVIDMQSRKKNTFRRRGHRQARPELNVTSAWPWWLNASRTRKEVIE